MILFKKTGFEALNEEEKKTFDKISNDYTEKIERVIKNIECIDVRIKGYHNEGKSKKFSIHAKAIIPGKMIEVEAVEWDLTITLHLLFKKMLESAERNFRVSDQHKKNWKSHH